MSARTRQCMAMFCCECCMLQVRALTFFLPCVCVHVIVPQVPHQPQRRDRRQCRCCMRRSGPCTHASLAHLLVPLPPPPSLFLLRCEFQSASHLFPVPRAVICQAHHTHAYACTHTAPRFFCIGATAECRDILPAAFLILVLPVHSQGRLC